MNAHSATITMDRPTSATAPAARVDRRALPEDVPLPAEEPAAPVLGPQPAGSRRRLRRLLLVGASALALVAAADFGWHYWTVGRFEVSTDDAYVQADNSTIAPKVSGYIAAVPVNDNEAVKAGQVLARIDDRDFRVALDQAKADVAASEAAVSTKQAALDAQQSIIATARATVGVDQADLTFAKQDAQRYSDLAATGFGSMQNAQRTASRRAAVRASVARDGAALDAATHQRDVLAAELVQAQAALARARALEHQAELNLSYATIVAPIDGVVGNRALRVGQYVQAGTQLMAVVPLEAAYIVANYKETQLTHVLPGQPVELEVDTYPGTTFKGHVDSIAPASGQEFALLPPDNATGNFTKIVQRIPVKIVLDPGSPLAGTLRPGMSVYPTIDTKPTDRTATASTASNPAGRG